MNDITYSARPSLATKETAYTLAADCLRWQVEGGTAHEIPYAGVKSIQLISYATAAGTAYQCKIVGGTTLKIRSHHFLGFGRLENRVATYAPFVRALCAQTAAVNPGVRLIAGSTALWLTWLIIAIFAAVALVLLVVAILGGASLGASAIPALVILAAGVPLGIREIRKGGARSFDPHDPPAALIGAA